MDDTEVKPKLSKHISAAVNAIQKEIDKKYHQLAKLKDKAQEADKQAEIIDEEISGLQEQIGKLRGE